MDAFQKLSKQKQKKKSRNRKKTEQGAAAAEDQEDEEELKPLPDLLSFVTRQLKENSGENDRQLQAAAAAISSANGGDDHGSLLDVPPNSVEPVERTLSVYEDDFLTAETEDIELF